MLRNCGRIVALAVIVSLGSLASLSDAYAQAIVSGYNQSGGTGPQVPVPFPPGSNEWILEGSLIFDPTAPPMTKFFGTPTGTSGAPILLDATQPFPFLVHEYFALLPLPGTTGFPVEDWHERIVTPGWVWIVPGDPNFPALFPPGTSLITRDGQPWPSVPSGPSDPTSVDVVFPPIEPGHVLDIHKALLWVGTDTQRIWGDDPTETGIVVIEYPTPEPSSFVLGAFALVGLAVWHWRRRHS